MKYYIINKDGGPKDEITRKEVKEYVSRIYGNYRGKIMLEDIESGKAEKIDLQFTIIKAKR